MEYYMPYFINTEAKIKLRISFQYEYNISTNQVQKKGKKKGRAKNDVCRHTGVFSLPITSATLYAKFLPFFIVVHLSYCKRSEENSCIHLYLHIW